MMLGRLVVDERHQKNGIGPAMLMEAMQQTLEISPLRVRSPGSPGQMKALRWINAGGPLSVAVGPSEVGGKLSLGSKPKL